MANCRLECTTDGFKVTQQLAKTIGDVHQFSGPVKVMLVEGDPHDYTKKTWAAACIAMTYLAMGAAIFPVLYFTLDKRYNVFSNLHIYMFTIAFQLFLPTAHLSINKSNPVASLMRDRHKKLESSCLKLAGLLCIAIGSLSLLLIDTKFSLLDGIKININFSSWHAKFGVLACFLYVVDLLHALCLCCMNTKNMCIKLMTVLSLPTFVISSACFCLGVYETKFQKWVPVKYMTQFTVLYCGFYTLIVVYFVSRVAK